MLEIDNISVSYGDIQVIFDLSLKVEDGEIVTLIGSNGAGKTTTCNTVSGILQPKKGDIRYKGQSILSVPAHKRVEMGIVQVPESRMLFPNLTVRENLKLGAFPKIHRSKFDSQLAWVYELFPRLKERMGQQVATLSGGEQQMVAIGRALMSHPQLLMLDEPSIGLAPLIVREMFSVIDEINKHGVSVMLIEQNAIQALRAADRGYVLEHGQLAQQGPADALLSDDNIRSAYLGI